MAVETDAGFERLLAWLVDRIQKIRPTRIGRQLLPLFQNQLAKLIDAEIGD